ncbi:phosphomannomutase/phosphoglucomutase [Robiginitomaculum antarcticum]|uniref:phosphomannomutase/phosphoglucomutase n=1 Tax=Robiginitomaculum antarcticum TaxID=437507 RepID=UPI00035E50A5|nr:phosphomannomutase/phosphoglucomutase [Robiginitomaculum antarcticum]
MTQHPLPHIDANSIAFETRALVKPTGFREYDARWWFGGPEHEKAPELNLYGVQALGAGLGELIHELGRQPEIVTAHDFRHYSLSIKQALMTGLMSAGIHVKDIGMALSPMAYFAQFHLDCASVAMVTASHNSNGWTGVKMGVNRPLTFGPDEMSRLKDIVLGGLSKPRTGGGYEYVDGVREAYIADLAKDVHITRKIKVIAACGNGTAGAFAPDVLKAIGVDVIEMDCKLDWRFPKYNPNPEDMKMLHAMSKAVAAHGADLAVGFDGDGDRCGIVDNEGEEIFADKVGVMLARDLAKNFKNAVFVADVKSTGLYATDPVLKSLGATTDYWKTGHSYIKARTQEIGALAGFEKSGHYFFGAPLGRGYDDGLLSAIEILKMLDRNPDKSMSDLRRALPLTYGSPTMSPYCSDETKYGVVDKIIAGFKASKNAGETIDGQAITDLNTVNGVRVTLEDGTWGLVRASSNTPNLVVVVESPVSEANKIAMFREIERRLSTHPEIGEFDQKI